ncbi:hypothetical protein X743_31405 [Mesorhizobium sp. LNHC252B00]|nr:hypothetical protein X743_31405 [Mesorhizobium sp. LNHC252B00]
MLIALRGLVFAAMEFRFGLFKATAGANEII